MLTDPALQALMNAMNHVNALVLGKPQQVRKAFVCLLAGGHLLIEDLPGLGKTTLARAMAATLGLQFQRMQFTADLLPSDVLGVSVYNQNTHEFVFHRGPVFTQVLLTDEINRAPPRTQSALLEAMAEQQISMDGVTHALAKPFMVMATQNPQDNSGAFALPDSQLDRFLMRISMGYPSAEAERAMLAGDDRADMIQATKPLLTAQQVLDLQNKRAQIYASEALIDYVQRLLEATRSHEATHVGLSPRAGIALLQAARAHAILHGSDYVRPDDVMAVFTDVAAHRMQLRQSDGDPRAWCDALLQHIAVTV